MTFFSYANSNPSHMLMLINQDQRRLENQFVQYKKAIFFEVGDNFSKKKQNPFNEKRN